MKVNKALGILFKGGSTLAILRLTLLTTTVLATAFLYYDWSVTMTGSKPMLVFYKWADGTNATTIDLTYNIFQNIWLVDNNATYGIKNGYASAKTVYFWAESCNATTWFQNFTVQVLDTTGSVLATWTTTDFSNTGESNAVSYSHAAGAIYTIKVLFKGSSSVVVGNAVRVQMKLKVQES